MHLIQNQTHSELLSMTSQHGGASLFGTKRNLPSWRLLSPIRMCTFLHFGFNLYLPLVLTNFVYVVYRSGLLNSEKCVSELVEVICFDKSFHRSSKGRFTRYDFVAYNLLVTCLRHILGHDCRKVLKHVLKSYDFFSCRKRVIRRLRAIKSYRVNRP